MEIIEIISRSRSHSFHSASISSSIDSSHPNCCLQSSCSSFLAVSVTGVMKPKGSYNELMTDSSPRLVAGFFLNAELNWKQLFSTFHDIHSPLPLVTFHHSSKLISQNCWQTTKLWSSLHIQHTLLFGDGGFLGVLSALVINVVAGFLIGNFTERFWLRGSFGGFKKVLSVQSCCYTCSFLDEVGQLVECGLRTLLYDLVCSFHPLCSQILRQSSSDHQYGLKII